MITIINNTKTTTTSVPISAITTYIIIASISPTLYNIEKYLVLLAPFMQYNNYRKSFEYLSYSILTTRRNIDTL